MALEQSMTSRARPTLGLCSYLPSALIPYLELSRLHKPLPILIAFFPCLFGILYAASVANPVISPSHLLAIGLALLINATIVRAIGCTWNDFLDRDLDIKVSRTRFRPLARGDVSPRGALAYLGLQILMEIGLLQLLPTLHLFYTIPWFILIGIYPVAKRITVYPQAVLGITAAWGVLLGFSSLGLEIQSSHINAITSLFIFIMARTVSTDFVHAFQDLQDDRREGIKSMAVRHENKGKIILGVLVVIQATFLWTFGAAVGASPMYYISTFGSIISSASLTYSVDLQGPKNYAYWFKHGTWMTGGAASIGLFSEYNKRLRAI